MKVNSIAVKQLDFGKEIAKDIAFGAMMQKVRQENLIRALEEERKRKAGGGGGGSSRKFDRVTVSMALMNFLSDKQIKAMIQNMDKALLQAEAKTSTNVDLSQLPILKNVLSIISKPVSVIVSSLLNIARGLIAKTVSLSKQLTIPIISLAQAVSLKLGVLKDSLNELKEKLSKLNIKSKLKKLGVLVVEFIDEIKDTFSEVYSFFNDVVKQSLRESLSLR